VKIIKVGNGTKARPMLFKEGQTAYRVHQWGCDVEINDELYFLLDQDALLAVE
jgi:co-chaperonin GroES (HSP10)